MPPNESVHLLTQASDGLAAARYRGTVSVSASKVSDALGEEVTADS